MKVEVHPPNPAWGREFEQEAGRVAQALGSNQVAIHHIGSTAIPHIYAKPIIDLLAEVRDLALVDRQTPALIALDYAAMGEFGIPGRRYFRKNNAAGLRTHHLHVFEAQSPEVKRHLAFRDYLTAHPSLARQYSDLKRQLAAQFADDIEGYMDGKDGLIKTLEQQALTWWRP